MLRYIRIAIAAIVVIVFFYSFTTFSGSELSRDIAKIAHFQIVPSILASMIGITIFFFILTLVFGRVYCSMLCPLGILQDVIARVAKFFRKILKRKKERQKFRKPQTILRYSILAVTIICCLAGSNFLLITLDPYSNFGRIVVNIFKPIVLMINNLGAILLQKIDNFYLYAVNVEILSLYPFIVSLVIFIILVVMVVKRQRLWCNTICPVGTLLGVISKVSLFKLTIDQTKCSHCKKCLMRCKSNCIDDKNSVIDNSRCVECFNCVTDCSTSAIKFKLRGKVSIAQNASDKIIDSPTKTRREFISLIATASALPLVDTAKKLRLDASRYPLPPGAGSIDEFQRKCTACKLCVSHCPSHLLRPALFENGINGFMQPYMNFDVHRFCEYECKACIDVCPNHALKQISLEEKKLTQVGVVNFDIDTCVVKAKDQYCGACAEHCPTQAVRMEEYLNGLTIPVIDPSICIGCGACESICPVRPDAIYVVRNDLQVIVAPPQIKESEKINVDDFGF